MSLQTWMRGSADCPEPTVPASFVLQIAKALAAIGGDEAQLLGELALSEETLSEPERRVALPELIAIVERAAALSSWPELTLSLGMSASVTRFGPVGFAAMSCANLGEAISTGIRFAPLMSSALRLHLRDLGDRAALEVEQVFPLGAAALVVVPSLMIALWRVGEICTGRALPGDMELCAPEPETFRQYAHFAPGEVRFEQPCDRLVFDRAFLELPLVSADLAAARATREQCERMLSELTSAATLAERVRRSLFTPDGEVCSPRRLARQLGMSERTLKRRLAAQGTSYTELLDAARRTRALELLGSDVSVEEVSARLGYSDAANFTRAFRRWTGQSPRALRQSARAARG